MLNDKLYTEIVAYCKKLYYCKNLHKFSLLSYFDIAHSVISDSDFSEIDYKKIAKSYTMSILTERKKQKKVSLEAIGLKDINIKIMCLACGIDCEEKQFNQSTSICNNCYRKKNKDRINENQRKHREKYPMKHKEYNAVYSKKYNAENRERLKEYKAKWYRENKEKQNALNKNKKNENNNS